MKGRKAKFICLYCDWSIEASSSKLDGIKCPKCGKQILVTPHG